MRLIVAITGATGAIYGIRLLETLRAASIETHLLISRWGKVTIETESGRRLEEVIGQSTFYHAEDNLGAVIASGSFRCAGMIIAPCSMKTLAGIAGGYADNLILRAADVTLKENRKLVLLARETPLSPLHLENMLKLSRLGVIITPPMPAFYSRPKTLDDIVGQTVGRVLDIFGIQYEGLKRWEGLPQ
ncbi:MAG: UbiX family flavin prenyltransferase [bacterium]|jgi:4-hydroxy-3-polyprenylbenzoate decarboxylase